MPYANPEIKKQKDIEYKQRPDVKARNNELYRERYAKDVSGIRTTKRKEHHDRWADPEYRAKKKAQVDARWEKDWLGQRLVQVKANAKKRGIPFSITKNDLFLPDTCPVFGTKFNLDRTTDRNNTPSIDRIDNSKGYVKGNVVIVSNRANMIKKDASLKELKLLVAFYENLIEDYTNE